MAREDDYVLDQIKRHSEAQRRVDEKQYQAAIDPVTSLFKRNIGEDFLNLQLGADRSVTVALVVLAEEASKENDGLLSIGRTLAEFSQAFDMICRWDEHRFLLASSDSCNSQQAVLALQERICRLAAAGDATVHARVGVARSRNGDTAAGLIARAEAGLT